MRHYRITEDFRNGINEFLGVEYIKKGEVGHEIYHLENYEEIARVSPEKAKVLLAALFPEELKDAAFLSLHKEEVVHLARNLHVEERKLPAFSWSDYMVRREFLPPDYEGRRDEDILKGNIVRFR